MKNKLYDISGIPDELKARDRRWLIWYKDGKTKKHWTRWKSEKIGENGNPKRTCDQTDPNCLSTLEWAVNNSKEGQGIGYSLQAEDQLVCVDLDDCRNPTDGTLSPFARKILDLLGPTWVETSQSGEGLHIWVHGKVPANKTKQDAAILGFEGVSLELKKDRFFISVTGYWLSEFGPKEIVDKSDEIMRLWEDVWSKPIEVPEQRTDSKPRSTSKATEDRSLRHCRRINALLMLGLSDAEIIAKLDRELTCDQKWSRGGTYREDIVANLRKSFKP